MPWSYYGVVETGRLVLVLGVLWGGALAYAQNAEDDFLHKNRSAYFQSALTERSAIADLPATVQAPDGQLTLWADFSHSDEHGVPLYLVNRTGEVQEFFTQDGDPYVMMEYQTAGGDWKRAQAHLSSWCGNSYGKVTLPPRQFFLFHGYHVSQGKPCKIHYACIDPTKIHPSEEGQGFISEDDLAAVALDSLTAREVPESIAYLLTVPQRIPKSIFGAPRVPELLTTDEAPAEPEPGASRIDPRPQPTLKRRMEAVRALAWMEKNDAAVRMVRTLQEKVKAAPPNDHTREALRTIEDVLSHAWKKPIPPHYLLRLCIASVMGAASPDKAVVLPSEKFAWSVLRDLTERRPMPTGEEIRKPMVWQPVIAAAVSRMMRGDDKDRAAQEVISNEWLLSSFVPQVEIESWLKCSNEDLQMMAAVILAQRSKYERLAELALDTHLSARVELAVLKNLAYGGAEISETRGAAVRRPVWGKEREFWERCMKEHTLEAAYALWNFGAMRDANVFDRTVHDPLHAFLEGEAARGAAAPADFDMSNKISQLRQAVEFLGSWKLREDVPLLQKLLLHRGYYRIRGWEGSSTSATKRMEKRNYEIRDAAADGLRAMKIAVPPDLVTLQDVSPDSKSEKK